MQGPVERTFLPYQEAKSTHMIVREVLRVLFLYPPPTRKSFHIANMHDYIDRPHRHYDRPPSAEDFNNVKSDQWPWTSPQFDAKCMNGGRILRFINERIPFGDKDVFDYFKVVNGHGGQQQ